MKNGYKKNYHLERKFREYRDLRDMLRDAAAKYGEKTAFVTKVKDEEKKIGYINTSYIKMLDDVNCLGTALWERGFSGERIAMIGENSYNWVLSFFTAGCGLGVVVPLDKALPADELDSLIKRSSSSLVFCDKKHYKMIKEIALNPERGVRLIVGLDFDPEEGVSILALLDEGRKLLDAGDTRFTEAEIDREALSYLLFTSGTTNRSKAVMLSQKNLMSVNYYMNCEELFFPDDVCMLILPLHHIYGMGGTLVFISQGLKCVFCDGLKYIVNNMKEYGVTCMMTVPLLLENVYKKICKGIEKQGKTETVKKALAVCDAADRVGINLRPLLFKTIHEQLGGHMRFFINGAAALDPVVSKGLNDLGILTVQGYGLTEVSPTIASETYRYIKPGSVGKVLPHVEARIDDPDENGIGELVVKGDNVMLGYYDDPEATAEVLSDGWFRTGDLARFDEDGYLWITGRKKNVIVMKNGKNVFPEEIENLVNNLPYIDESMVFIGEKQNDVVLWIKAVYSREYLKEAGMTAEELEKLFEKDLAAINEGMPAYKMIKHYLFSERPTVKTTTQKTKRNVEMEEIRKELAEKGIEL